MKHKKQYKSTRIYLKTKDSGPELNLGDRKFYHSPTLGMDAQGS